MQRRDLLAVSVGAFVATAIGGVAFGPLTSAPTPTADDETARRHDRERRFAETAFGRIAPIDRGTGPAAVFAQRSPLSSFQWRGTIDRLSADRRCLAPDLMGLGHSEIVPGRVRRSANRCRGAASINPTV